jgi:hypothetical protein
MPFVSSRHVFLLAVVAGICHSAAAPKKLIEFGWDEPSPEFMRKHVRELEQTPFDGCVFHKKHLSAGFGIWMDKDWRKRGWDTNDFSKNYFTPETFAASVQSALARADEYVWIYTETPRWWSNEGVPVQLPPAYAAALRGVRPKTKP